MFKGINKEWKSCNTNPTNVKELIPEFFMDSDTFLVNHLKLDLGLRANGKRVDDIKLPKWALSPEDFLRKNRQALESAYVSSHLHLWIDLVFGIKQNSVENNNVYHPYSYEGFIDFSSIQDPQMKKAYETHVREFGQTPRQLFTQLHPKRLALTNSSPASLSSKLDDMHIFRSGLNNSDKDTEEVKEDKEEENMSEISASIIAGLKKTE
jgi:factor associated with neutral sphingomyelinase activation